MAKHRKTREEKKLADSRHNFTHKFVNSAPFELKLGASKKTKSTEINTVSAQALSTGAYGYLVKDLSKTALLTGTILAAQIILFFLFKNHIFVIPGLNY